MGSFEEDYLYQIQIDDDFLGAESVAVAQSLLPVSSQNPFFNDHHAKYYIVQEIVERGTSAEVGVLGYVMKHMRKKPIVDCEKIIGQKKLLVKSLKNDGYNASLRHNYWPTSPNCPGGEYEYIEILCEGKKERCPRRVIVDIDFRSQFEVARPTPKYKELCDILPLVFVGEEQKLKNIISILCGEAENSFRQRGLNVPPWRSPSYLHCKWFSSPSYENVLPSLNTSAERSMDVVGSSMMIKVPRRKLDHGVVDQYCGLSSQFSAMTTNCS